MTQSKRIYILIIKTCEWYFWSFIAKGIAYSTVFFFTNTCTNFGRKARKSLGTTYLRFVFLFLVGGLDMLCLFMSGLLYISIKIHHLPYRKISSFYISAFGFLYFMDSSGIVNDLNSLHRHFENRKKQPPFVKQPHTAALLTVYLTIRSWARNFFLNNNLHLVRKYARIFVRGLHVYNDIFDVVPRLTST